MIKYSDLVRNRWKYIEYLDRRKYRLKESVRFWVDYDHQNEFIDVPEGFVFDFNSSPCFAHCVVDRDEFCIAIIHDMLYKKEGKVMILDPDHLSPRFEKLKKHSVWQKIFWNDDGKHAEFLYNRKFADLLWLYGAIEEAEEIERVRKSFKIFLGYWALRLGWSRGFKK